MAAQIKHSKRIVSDVRADGGAFGVARSRAQPRQPRSLPPASRNIEVSVQNGIVTLKGEVQSDEESQAIQGKAESLIDRADAGRAGVHTSSRDLIHNDLAVDSH
jgi:hypothetical protein